MSVCEIIVSSEFSPSKVLPLYLTNLCCVICTDGDGEIEAVGVTCPDPDCTTAHVHILSHQVCHTSVYLCRLFHLMTSKLFLHLYIRLSPFSRPSLPPLMGVGSVEHNPSTSHRSHKRCSGRIIDTPSSLPSLPVGSHCSCSWRVSLSLLPPSCTGSAIYLHCESL